MEHFAFPGNIDFAADDQGAFHVLFMKGCCVYSSSVKQCLPSVNHGQFPIQITQNCKHSKCLQILAEEDFPLKLLWRTPIKIHRRADRRRQPRSREHRFSTAKATSSTQRPQTCTEAATKYYNYIVNETDEEREHRLPTLPKATRLDQATLKVYRQNYLLRCSDRQQELCTSRISFLRLGTADQPLHHEQQWVLQQAC
ncbi:unnamed protein product [Porites lobata]|uniref:Uncharacterized protein n=1 Tax=Porites lobata TaxID=104759 RepID=A0ABN8MT17_9CNID|nr:unnamed protein product [Porites lobata]